MTRTAQPITRRPDTTVQVTVHNAIDEIAADDWNRLSGTSVPFLRHEFLALAEASRCVSPEQGWTARHLTVSNDGNLRGAMLLYEKSHSWGEFVFDWAWANAYEQAGLDYYPKLVSATPFTPAPGRRLLLAKSTDTEVANALLQAATTLAEETACSSLHVQFPLDDELPLLEDAGLMIRKDCQFHWHNQNYRDFDAFLATFTSSKRKKARRDRRRVSENGIQFRHLRGNELDEELWALVYPLIARTFMRRGSMPYFDENFFIGLSEALPDNLLVVLAEHRGTAVAAAVFFVGETRLYGRYWGSNGHYDALHFETCYYQGIDYCIDNGLRVFEPGTQGEHKISRGFSPVATWSAHRLFEPQFSAAIERYLDEEARHVDRYIDSVESHSPYKQSNKPHEQ